ncbi:hypothetical protein U27_02868 [Candidatus Vecturithrix granuli]|uniref:GTP-binding protein n=1 Tax=Vecturithrix granuli TaxID=1499967 RepID=A0A081BUA2_VECG1|nr:hypothetical protein U27_02868 [Candidatus Vecturithrix granuli]
MRLDPQKLLREGKLIAALMSSELDLLQEVEQRLGQIFGPCELTGELYSFDAFSAYYEREMGTRLQKKFISFADMIQVETLPDIKHRTNAIEAEYAVNEQRRINIDPGYVTHAQMVLATTKPYSHRIYLGNGIHAELTYLCKGKNFYPMAWTYPDYRQPFAIRFFEQVRALYLQEMRARRESKI